MNKLPFVSIIIPNYNHARFLEQRLYSVLNQTYQEFELIILDDKSSDNSLEIIDKYKHNSHIAHIVVNDVNSGNPFKQWSKGISLAKGDIIWIAESDDWCELDLLEKLVNAYIVHKDCSIAYCTLTIVDEKNDVLEKGKNGKNKYISGCQYVKRYLSLANIIRNSSCAIFSSEVAKRIPKDYEDYNGAGDYLFWVNLALRGDVAIVNSPLCYYRRHSEIVTSLRDSDGTNFTEEKKIYDYISQKVHLSWLRKQGVLYYHWIRIINTEYENEDIRTRLYELWNVPYKYSIIQLIVKEIQGFVRTKFNLYL